MVAIVMIAEGALGFVTPPLKGWDWAGERARESESIEGSSRVP